MRRVAGQGQVWKQKQRMLAAPSVRELEAVLVFRLADILQGTRRVCQVNLRDFNLVSGPDACLGNYAA